jgi:hypothetical protein
MFSSLPDSVLVGLGLGASAMHPQKKRGRHSHASHWRDSHTWTGNAGSATPGSYSCPRKTARSLLETEPREAVTSFQHEFLSCVRLASRPRLRNSVEKDTPHPYTNSPELPKSYAIPVTFSEFSRRLSCAHLPVASELQPFGPGTRVPSGSWHQPVRDDPQSQEGSAPDTHTNNAAGTGEPLPGDAVRPRDGVASDVPPVGRTVSAAPPRAKSSSLAPGTSLRAISRGLFRTTLRPSERLSSPQLQICNFSSTCCVRRPNGRGACAVRAFLGGPEGREETAVMTNGRPSS